MNNMVISSLIFVKIPNALEIAPNERTKERKKERKTERKNIRPRMHASPQTL